MLLIALNKPFNVLCQFSPEDGKSTLAEYINIKNIYPVGRLDYKSEGLVLLTDDGLLQHKISSPKFDKFKTYLVQVENIPNEQQPNQLRGGVNLIDYISKPAIVNLIDEPQNLWQRVPPIRERKAIPTTWLSISITEGKNHQVRKMTAQVGLPTLRLIRVAIDKITLDELQPGESKVLDYEYYKNFFR